MQLFIYLSTFYKQVCYSFFTFFFQQNTRFASHGFMTKSKCNTSKHGTNTFAASTIASWNFFQKEFPSNNLRQILNSNC